MPQETQVLSNLVVTTWKEVRYLQECLLVYFCADNEVAYFFREASKFINVTVFFLPVPVKFCLIKNVTVIGCELGS